MVSLKHHGFECSHVFKVDSNVLYLPLGAGFYPECVAVMRSERGGPEIFINDDSWTLRHVGAEEVSATLPAAASVLAGISRQQSPSFIQRRCAAR